MLCAVPQTSVLTFGRKEVRLMAEKAGKRAKAAPRRDGREQMIEKVRERERRAVEKAVEIAVKVYGSAFKELEKY